MPLLAPLTRYARYATKKKKVTERRGASRYAVIARPYIADDFLRGGGGGGQNDSPVKIGLNEGRCINIIGRQNMY